jgi:hypothetical protein
VPVKSYSCFQSNLFSLDSCAKIWLLRQNSIYLMFPTRDAELEANDDLLIGPPPPAVVAEAASANEAERFEEVHSQQ